MVIDKMGREECCQILGGARLARLACAHENQPYVVPVFLSYNVSPDGSACLYGFTTPGLKLEWMRANPLVCVEVDEIDASDRWVSVVVMGRYEELGGAGLQDEQQLTPRAKSSGGLHLSPDTVGDDWERYHAYQSLQAHAVWWEPATSSHTDRDPAEPLTPIFYKIRIDQITGHRATLDEPRSKDGTMSGTPFKKPGRLRRLLTQLFR